MSEHYGMEKSGRDYHPPAKSWDDILAAVYNRRMNQGELIARMIEVRERYNGDYVVPLPVEGDDAPLPPMTAQIVADAVDGNARQAASVMPSILSPALDSGKVQGTRSTEYANIRKRALGYTWGESSLNLALRRTFRQLGAYSSYALCVTIDPYCNEPRIVTRDPLLTYPEPKDDGDLSPIKDCAFVYGKSPRWLLANFPEAAEVLGPQPPDQTWDVVEWIDDEQIVYGILGPREDINRLGLGADVHTKTKMLRRFPNKAGMCTAVAGQAVTLDKMGSQLANIVGQTDMMARLQALQIRGVERSIWPDTYIVGAPNETPVLLNGAWREGVSGEVNLLQGVAQVGQLRGTPDPQATATIDRLERNARLSSGYVPAMGGETYGALRTGRGIDSMMGAAVDPRVQEMQETVAAALVQVNKVLIATYKGWWPRQKYVGFSRWPSDQTTVEFVPEKHFETDVTGVSYPIPGADVQSTTVMLGQLFGSKAISLSTFRNLHPYVADAEAESQRVMVEALDDAIFASLLQRMQEGGIPPIDQASLKRYLAKGMPIEEALEKVDQAAKERQAATAPDMGPLGQPAVGPDGQPIPGSEGMQGAPGAMPGLGNPGEGGEMMPPGGGALGGVSTPSNLDQFQQLSQALTAPQTGMENDQMVR